MYHIVLFEGLNEVEVVPSNWIHGQECMWPPTRVDVVKATKNREPPGEGWEAYAARVIFTASKFNLVDSVGSRVTFS